MRTPFSEIIMPGIWLMCSTGPTVSYESCELNTDWNCVFRAPALSLGFVINLELTMSGVDYECPYPCVRPLVCYVVPESLARCCGRDGTVRTVFSE